MDFYSFLDIVSDEWEKTGRSEAQLAKAIGINPATFNLYKNRMRGVPKTEKIKYLFINYFKDTHPEVYDVLDAPRPFNPRSALQDFGFPPEIAKDLSDKLTLVLKNSLSIMEEKGISKDSPEGLEIVKEELSKLIPSTTDTE